MHEIDFSPFEQLKRMLHAEKQQFYQERQIYKPKAAFFKKNKRIALVNSIEQWGKKLD